MNEERELAISVVIGIAVTIGLILLGTVVIGATAEYVAPEGSGADWRTPPEGIALGRALFRRHECSECHGSRGIGGVENLNSIQGEVPNLADLAERVRIEERDIADAVGNILAYGGSMDEVLTFLNEERFRGAAGTVATLTDALNTIRNGSVVPAQDPTLPPPSSMQAWSDVMTDEETSAVLGYVLTLYDWNACGGADELEGIPNTVCVEEVDGTAVAIGMNLCDEGWVECFEPGDECEFDEETDGLWQWVDDSQTGFECVAEAGE